MKKRLLIEPKVIPFADNLAEILPTDYVNNLAILSIEQRAAISEDLRRWHLAETMFQKRRVAVGVDSITKANREIGAGLLVLPEGPYREDIRRRLNILKGKLK